MLRKRTVLRSQWLKTRVSLLTPGTCPCTSWVGGGSALCQRSLCFRACLSRTLLAAAAEGKEKPDWVGTGVKCPSWGLSPSHEWVCSASHPAPPNHKAGRSGPAGSLEGEGRRVWCWSRSGLEHPASPLTWSPTKCHPFQEALPGHLGPGYGEAETRVSPCFHLGWEGTLSGLRGTGPGGQLHLRHIEVEVPLGHLGLRERSGLETE